MKVVIDTNVLIPGLLWEGTPKQCLDAYRFQSAYQLVLSPEIVHEFRSKLIQKFHVPISFVEKWVREITLFAQLVIPVYKTRICRDTKDNMVLDTAEAGNADYIITGDKDLLAFHTFQSISIISPKIFRQMLVTKG